MKRKMRSRRLHSGVLLDISMTPLIDTALTLLIIFMITTPIIQNAIRVSLPKGEAKEDEGGSQELIVYIDKDKHLFFNGQEYEQEKIVELIKKHVGEQEEKKVYVKADQEVSYGQVIGLVDRLKVVSGVSHVILATQRLT
ncbi:biopolymer transporter ExbD [Candidatus Dependentiae bacterium]|nr:MAG: biopolymer transporter ExbD [Candidatus Dependentiae bacterium]